ncbi:MAG: L-threonylcarbamoyladenylate synthase [Nitrospinota bacterium]
MTSRKTAPRRLVVNPEDPEASVLAEAARILRAGGLIGLPTETFYALAADGLSREAVSRALSAKGRDTSKPAGLLVADAEMVSVAAERIPDGARSLMERFWPGPLSLILSGKKGLPPGVLGERGGVSVRLPASAVAVGLIRLLGIPVTATSANRAGDPPPRTADEVLRGLGESVEAVLDAGEAPGGLPSTLVDARGESPVLLREGGIPWEEVVACTG